MFRLMAALLIAGLLLPSEVLTQNVKQENINQGYSLENEVSPFQAYSAVNSLYHDVTHFCIRNADACETGKKLATNAFYTVKGTLSQIMTEEPQSNQNENLDYTKTGSIKK